MTESIPKADYSAIAPTYDEAGRLSDDAIEMWVDLIRDEGKLTPGSLFMDRVFCRAERAGFSETRRRSDPVGKMQCAGTGLQERSVPVLPNHVGCVSFVQPRMKTWRQCPSVSFFACL
jgi:hypothetical protein